MSKFDYIRFAQYNVYLPKDYHLVKAHAAGGEACELLMTPRAML
jgi:hypothetical protein